MTKEEAIKIIKEAIDFINHQKIAILNLKDYNEVLLTEIRKLKGFTTVSNVVTENQRRIKAEAYKAFAEHLKEEWFNNHYYSPDVDFDEFVDNLLKEMIDG